MHDHNTGFAAKQKSFITVANTVMRLAHNLLPIAELAPRGGVF
jgi:hypothetical protein